MQNCFTYGSLMCADIMSAVSGSTSAHVAATLAGYRRRPVRGQDYPGMQAAPGHCVAGVLYLNLPESAWPRLDRFEGEEYARQEVRVTLPDGTQQTAWTYVFRAELGERLDDGEWDFAHFLSTGKTRFAAQYVGFATLADDCAN